MDQDDSEPILGRSGFQFDEPDDYWRRFYQRA
jgi:hypothetical protein